MTDDILNIHQDTRFRQLHGYIPRNKEAVHKLIDELEREHIIWEKHGLAQIVTERNAARQRIKNLEEENSGLLARLEAHPECNTVPADEFEVVLIENQRLRRRIEELKAELERRDQDAAVGRLMTLLPDGWSVSRSYTYAPRPELTAVWTVESGAGAAHVTVSASTSLLDALRLALPISAALEDMREEK